MSPRRIWDFFHRAPQQAAPFDTLPAVAREIGMLEASDTFGQILRAEKPSGIVFDQYLLSPSSAHVPMGRIPNNYKYRGYGFSLIRCPLLSCLIISKIVFEQIETCQIIRT